MNFMIFSDRTEKKTGPSGERFQLFYLATAFFSAGDTLIWTPATFSVKEKESNGTRLAKRPGCVRGSVLECGRPCRFLARSKAVQRTALHDAAATFNLSLFFAFAASREF
jgi:hypothetical protein